MYVCVFGNELGELSVYIVCGVCICMYAEECIECGHFALGDGRRERYVCVYVWEFSLSLSLYEL